MAPADASEFPLVTTFSGPVRGRVENGLAVFRGIRYGASTAGAGRFKPSRRPQPWSEPQDAFVFGAAAIQMPVMGIADNGAPSPLRTALEPILPASDDKATEDEDCLFLNVWTPGIGDTTKRPVMIWLHGGGYAAGSAGWPVSDGAALARNGDLVVVSLNHRLNVFGFLYLGELAGPEYAQSGNAGMLDIMLAIWWVRDNIAKFGGNPADVTVFGESGGGLKVSTLLAMRSARGLVRKAIIQSGPGLRCLAKDAATAAAKAVLDELELKLPGDIERLRSLPANVLVGAAIAVQRREQVARRPIRFAPVMDSITMAGHPFEPVATPSAAKVPLLIGHTKDEGTFFIATDEKFGRFSEEDLEQRARAIAPGKSQELITAFRQATPHATPTELIAALLTATWAFSDSVTLAERKSQQDAPVYAYMLQWQTPVAGGALGATHALDLPMMFNTVEAVRSFVGAGEAPQRIADQMHAAWIAFARSGNPNTPGLPDWPPYSVSRRATLVFDLESRVVDDPWADIRRILAPAVG
jgi:para-nitrobenzyl esterase